MGPVNGRDDHYATLQVDPGARPEVIHAAFEVLRELILVDDSPDAPRLLARLNAAHRVLGDADLRARYDAERGGGAERVDSLG